MQFPLYPNSFLPTSIAGCKVWLDPADNSTITLSSGKATQWNDKSGNGNNVVQATSARQFTPTASAIGSQQAMLCNQTLNNMHCVLAGGTLATFSAFTVINCSALAQFDGIITSSSATGDLNLEIGPSANKLDVWRNNQGAVGGTANGTIATGTTYCVGMTYTSGALTVYINNVSAGTAASTSCHLGATFGVGGDSANASGFNGLKGYLGNVVVYDTILSSTDRNNLYNNFFKARYPVLP